MKSEKASLDYLSQLGAGEYTHINGSMIEHLKGTYSILRTWCVEESTAIAGLFHAIYGPLGLPVGLISLSKRKEIQDHIGQKNEQMVYLYCACDKPLVLPQFENNGSIQFYDRFTGENYVFPEEFMQGFCEITVANDLDVARQKSIESYSAEILNMFNAMQSRVNEKASKEIVNVLETFSSSLTDC